VTLAGDAVAGEPISIVGHQVNDGYLGIGVPKDQPTMVTFVNNWLKMIEKNGQWAGIWKATFGTVEAGGPPAPPTVGTVPGVRRHCWDECAGWSSATQFLTAPND